LHDIREKTTYMLFVLLCVLSAGVVSRANRDVIMAPEGDLLSKPAVALIFAPGADLDPDSYVPLMESMQKEMGPDFGLWVGIPHMPMDVSAIGLKQAVARVASELMDQGLPLEHETFYGGHSLGGAVMPMLVDTPEDLPEHFNTPKGVVLMGAFLTRSFRSEANADMGPGQYQFPTCPVLTIGAELDGLCRITRIAEARHVQVDLSESPQEALHYFPVTVVDGMSHMQFSSGEVPDLVLKRDLLPEITYDEAHEAVALDFSFFAKAQLGMTSYFNSLDGRQEQSLHLMGPLIESLRMEGYHQFKPPCYCEAVDEYGGLEYGTCPDQPGCQADCPWTETAQAIMGARKGMDFKTSDSQHIVTEEDPSCHLPHVHDGTDRSSGETLYNSHPSDNPGNGNSPALCPQPEFCSLNVSTVTQVIYETGSEFDIWRLVLGNDNFDTGYLPISAGQLKTKMKSRQALWQAANDTDALDALDALDGVEQGRCAEINNEALAYAYEKLPSKTRARYEKYGQKMVVKEGGDKEVCKAGPCWIWAPLIYDDQGDAGLQLLSPSFAEPNKNPFPCGEANTEDPQRLPCPAGMHYCKLLSPARAVEWMFVDSMRLHYSLLSQQPPVEKCCTTCESDADAKFWSIDDRFNQCGEVCFPPDQFDLWKKFEKNLEPAGDSNTPCADHGYSTYKKTTTHGKGKVAMEFDMYSVTEE
jgi:hypothetical protein